MAASTRGLCARSILVHAFVFMAGFSLGGIVTYTNGRLSTIALPNEIVFSSSQNCTERNKGVNEHNASPNNMFAKMQFHLYKIATLSPFNTMSLTENNLLSVQFKDSLEDSTIL